VNRTRAKQFIIVAAAAVLLGAAALSATTALAAKGGSGGHQGGGQNQTAGSCSVTPNPLASQTYGTLTGSGFTASAVVGYSVSGSGGVAMGSVGTDGSGNLSITVYGGWLGTNTVTFTGGASCSFTVI